MTKTYHYVYKIEFETGHVYFGSRSCKCKPADDVKYLGSPRKHKSHWETFVPTKVILREFDTREEANEYENVLIEWVWSVNQPLSLNANIGGVKFCTQGETADYKAKPFTVVSPQGEIISGRNLFQFCKEHNLESSNLSHVIKGELLHSKGWTANLKTHQLYLKAFEDRGITKIGKRRYRVRCQNEGASLSKYFKNRKEALAYRNKLESEGCIFRVVTLNWKEKIEELENNGCA